MGWSKAIVAVPDITCTACIETIESIFAADENVRIKVALVPEKEATLYYKNSGGLTLAQICDKIEDTGFTATVKSNEDDVDVLNLEKRDEFIIEGMTCNSCTATINAALKEFVLSCDISLGTKTALINYDAMKISPQGIIDKVEDCGFECKLKTASSSVTTATTKLAIVGMVCMSCVETIEGVLGEYTGVEKITVSLETETADITYQPSLIGEADLVSQIEDMGFEASPVVQTGLLKSTFSIVGMRCGSCVANITSACEGVFGVEQVLVQLEASQGWVVHSSATTAETLKETIAKLNFTVELVSSLPHHSAKPTPPPSAPKPIKPASVPGSISFSKSSEKVTITVSPTETCTLKIGGMTCASCVNNIEKTISKVTGVESILVSLMSGRGTCVYQTDVITPTKIAEAVEDMGFDCEVMAQNDSGARVETLRLTVTGMTCASCVRKIETSLARVEGIEKATVALTTSSAVITFKRETITPRVIIEKVKSLGFGAELSERFITFFKN